MEITFSFLVIIAAIGSVALPLAILLLKFDRQPVAYRWLTIVLLFSFSADLAGIVLMFNGINPNLAGNTHSLFNTALISIFFFKVLDNPRLKNVLIFLNALYLVFAVVNVMFIQKSGVNSYTQTFQSLLVMTLSMMYYYKLLRDLPTRQLHSLPLFWIVSAFFITYAGKLVVYTVTSYLILLEDDLALIWTLHNFLTIIANLLIGYGAWLNHRQLRSTSLSL